MSHIEVISSKKRTFIFISIVVSCIATTILSTALTTALPAIMEDLHITTNTGQWLTSGYSLVMGITMPLTAFLITRFPTKKLYLAAILLFIIGLILSAFATNFITMMFSRILQAIGNGILASLAQVILLTIYPMEKRGTMMGWYGLSVGAAPVIAPTLSGIIVDLFHWRAIFYSSIIIMIISFIFSYFVFEDVLDTKKHTFDYFSFIISAIAFGGITLAIGNIGTYSFISVPVIGILLLGFSAFILFVYRQLHIEKPFLELRILKNKNFAISVIGSMLLYLVMMGSTLLMPIYVQSILGYSATVSGLVILPGSLIMAIMSPLAGKIYDALGIKRLFLVGAICMLISNIGMFFIQVDSAIWISAVYNVIRCVSIGCLMMPLVTWGTSTIGREYMAHGTALLTSLRTVAGAIGSALFVNIMMCMSTTSYMADLRGLHIAFLAMSGVSLILFIVANFFVNDTKRTSN